MSSGTFSQIYIQLVFVVKGRENLLKKTFREEVFKYMSGIVKAKGQKSIIINGVEVAAPAKKDDIEQYFYTVNFSENTIHTIDKVYINNNFKYYWATEADAQKALDAMLIPFNNLNKGDK